MEEFKEKICEICHWPLLVHQGGKCPVSVEGIEGIRIEPGKKEITKEEFKPVLTEEEMRKRGKELEGILDEMEINDLLDNLEIKENPEIKKITKIEKKEKEKVSKRLLGIIDEINKILDIELQDYISFGFNKKDTSQLSEKEKEKAKRWIEGFIDRTFTAIEKKGGILANKDKEIIKRNLKIPPAAKDILGYE